MNQNEKEVINSIPEKYRPLGTWSFFGYSILFAIPVVGLIMLIIFALNDANICRRNYARSFFCIYIIVIVFLIIMGISGTFSYFMFK